MSGKTLIWLLATLLLATAPPADAQQPKKVPRIGYLGGTASNAAFNLKPFRERLHELGYVEGQNVTIEIRHHEGKVARLPDLAIELVRLKCDVIVTNGTDAAEAAKNTIKTIPVVMGWSADAVRLGIIADLARPGGNITGLTDVGAEINGKRLELLKEVVAKLSRVGFLWSSSSAVDIELKETEPVAQSLRVEIQSLEVKRPEDFEKAFQAATKMALRRL
ncbi:MAG: ABC transporter substrate-binding protein [Candidatus Binatia bacterium]